ncbi:MAG TPA: aminoacetone oxidase family FAD-binding enzyme [Pseudohongiella sp.]|nr:aminoacetone oxidase family FAD-binding enzyme [Pseudohongiella sp.]
MPENRVVPENKPDALVVGGGPAGLMAAQQLIEAGYSVVLCDAMPAVGRKLLRAGVGGLNLTHAEPKAEFISRFTGSADVTLWLEDFDAQSMTEWARELGIDTFVGSSGRVFPVQMKASPLLRAWLGQLARAGVEIRTRHRWCGWRQTADGTVHDFETSTGQVQIRARVCVLALGGASWSRLGSDGRWRDVLSAHNVPVTDFMPSNGGVEISWSPWFSEHFAGRPLKTVTLGVAGSKTSCRRGEAVVTTHGMEGGLIYALSASIRESLAKSGVSTLTLDLLPDLSTVQIRQKLNKPQGKMSRSNYLRKRLGLDGVKSALLRELVTGSAEQDVVTMALAAKQLSLRVKGMRPLDEAISTAGGVHGAALNQDLMLNEYPGLFCAGEMLDWDAPTGGYLLTASMASGLRAGRAAAGILGK